MLAKLMQYIQGKLDDTLAHFNNESPIEKGQIRIFRIISSIVTTIDGRVEQLTCCITRTFYCYYSIKCIHKGKK